MGSLEEQAKCYFRAVHQRHTTEPKKTLNGEFRVQAKCYFCAVHQRHSIEGKDSLKAGLEQQAKCYFRALHQSLYLEVLKGGCSSSSEEIAKNSVLASLEPRRCSLHTLWTQI